VEPLRQVLFCISSQSRDLVLVGGPNSSNPDANGYTLAKLTDSEWSEGDPHRVSPFASMAEESKVVRLKIEE
jgi:hypothetical protein